MGIFDDLDIEEKIPQKVYEDIEAKKLELYKGLTPEQIEILESVTDVDGFDIEDEVEDVEIIDPETGEAMKDEDTDVDDFGFINPSKLKTIGMENYLDRMDHIKSLIQTRYDELEKEKIKLEARGTISRLEANNLNTLMAEQLGDKVIMESFTALPTRTNFNLVMEEIDAKQGALMAGAAIVGLAVLYKLITWLGGSLGKTSGGGKSMGNRSTNIKKAAKDIRNIPSIQSYVASAAMNADEFIKTRTKDFGQDGANAAKAVVELYKRSGEVDLVRGAFLTAALESTSGSNLAIAMLMKNWSLPLVNGLETGSNHIDGQAIMRQLNDSKFISTCEHVLSDTDNRLIQVFDSNVPTDKVDIQDNTFSSYEKVFLDLFGVITNNSATVKNLPSVEQAKKVQKFFSEHIAKFNPSSIANRGDVVKWFNEAELNADDLADNITASFVDGLDSIAKQLQDVANDIQQNKIAEKENAFGKNGSDKLRIEKYRRLVEIVDVCVYSLRIYDDYLKAVGRLMVKAEANLKELTNAEVNGKKILTGSDAKQVMNDAYKNKQPNQPQNNPNNPNNQNNQNNQNDPNDPNGNGQVPPAAKSFVEKLVMVAGGLFGFGKKT